MRLTILTTIFVLSLHVAAYSAETNITVFVGGTKVLVPAPDQYVEVGSENRVFPSEARNRLLAWFVTPSDLKQFGSESTNLSKQYMQLQVSKGAENRDISASQFSELAGDVAKLQDASYASAVQDVNRIMKKLASESKDFPDLEIGQPKPLGSFLKTDTAVGFLMLMSISSNSKQGKEQIPMVCGTTLVRVKQKLLFAYVYCAADNKKATDWVKSTSKSWVEAILKAN